LLSRFKEDGVKAQSGCRLDIDWRVINEQAVGCPVTGALQESLKDARVGLANLLLTRKDDLIEPIQKIILMADTRKGFGRPVA